MLCFFCVYFELPGVCVPEHMFTFRIIFCPFTSCLVDIDGRCGRFAAEKIFLIFEEAHELAAQHYEHRDEIRDIRANEIYLHVCAAFFHLPVYNVFHERTGAFLPPLCNSCFLSSNPCFSTGGN